MENIMYKAIGHCRVSKGDADEIRNSLNSQKSEIIKFATKYNILEKEIKWYIEEEARSAYSEKANWSIFEEAIEVACTTSSIEYFIDYSQERFCRNRGKSQSYKKKLSKHNVTLCFVSGNIENPDTIEGFVQDSMGEMMAEFYSRKVGADTLRGCKENAQTRDPETGYAYKNGGVAPFWLKPQKIIVGKDKIGEDIKKVIWVENDNVYTANYNGKPVTKTIWEWSRFYFIELRLNQKLGIERARDVLNELGIPAPRKTLWATTCLYEAEKNEALIGIGTYNKKKKNGREKDKSEWISMQNAHPSLLTENEFFALQQLRQHKKKRLGTQTIFQSNNEHLLIGYPEKFTCSCCGSKIISSGNVYTCSKYNTYGKKGCGESYFSVNCEWLEEKIIQEIMKLFTDDEIDKAYKLFTKIYSQKKNNDNELKKLEKNISEHELKQTNLIQAITNIDGNALAIQELSKTLNVVTEKIQELKQIKIKLDKEKQLKVPSLNTFKKLILQAKLLLQNNNTAENKVFIWHFINSIKFNPTTREVIVELNKYPFCSVGDFANKNNTKKEDAVASSMKLVAGAGFEPTTFGL